jgi:hypothetical protein
MSTCTHLFSTQIKAQEGDTFWCLSAFRQKNAIKKIGRTKRNPHVSCTIFAQKLIQSLVQGQIFSVKTKLRQGGDIIFLKWKFRDAISGKRRNSKGFQRTFKNS